MLLSLTAHGPGATDIGFVLHKHPDRMRTVRLGFGEAHVFYPVVEPERVTATLYVEIDPVRLSRRRGNKNDSATLMPWVNDRPWVASSFLSVAVGKVFGTALAGACETKPELVDTAFELEIEVPVVAHRSSSDVARLFEPLGWAATTTPVGDHHAALTLRGSQCVRDALAHLFVLLPVLDGSKHYWIGDDEVEKLLRRGGTWLETHPEREFITRRYLRFASLTNAALERLSEGTPDPDEHETSSESMDPRVDQGEAAVERPIRLQDRRLDAVMEQVRASAGRRIIDLGCGEGQLLGRLMAEPDLLRVTGMDVSTGALQRAEKRLHVDEMSSRRGQKLELLQGALTYRDARLRGFDTAVLMEVIEHVDPDRLDALAQIVFGWARPPTVIVTTPNAEFNVHFPGLASGQFRHRDHRFEWTRAQFHEWSTTTAEQWQYSVSYHPIGDEDDVTGPPTQMAVFTLGSEVGS